MRPNQISLLLSLTEPQLFELPLRTIQADIKNHDRMTSVLVSALDRIYTEKFIRAVSMADFRDLYEHLGYMIHVYIPMHHLSAECVTHSYRWEMLRELARRRVAAFETPANIVSIVQPVLKAISCREHTERGLLEGVEGSNDLVELAISHKLVERVPLDRPHPIKEHEVTLVLTTLGRAAVSNWSSGDAKDVRNPEI